MPIAHCAAADPKPKPGSCITATEAAERTIRVDVHHDVRISGGVGHDIQSVYRKPAPIRTRRTSAATWLCVGRPFDRLYACRGIAHDAVGRALLGLGLN